MGLEIIIPWLGFFLMIWIAFEFIGLIGAMFGSGSSSADTDAHAGAKGFFENRKKKKEEKEKHDEDRAPHLRDIDHHLQGVRRTHLPRLKAVLSGLKSDIASLETDPTNVTVWQNLGTLAVDGMNVSHALHGDFKKVETNVKSFDSSRVRRFIAMGVKSSELIHHDFDNPVKHEVAAALGIISSTAPTFPSFKKDLQRHLNNIKPAVSKIHGEYSRLYQDLVLIDKEARHELDAMHH